MRSKFKKANMGKIPHGSFGRENEGKWTMISNLHAEILPWIPKFCVRAMDGRFAENKNMFTSALSCDNALKNQ